MPHLNLKTIELVRSNSISVLKHPPHITDILQMLDKCYFWPLKMLSAKNKILQHRIKK